MSDFIASETLLVTLAPHFSNASLELFVIVFEFFSFFLILFKHFLFPLLLEVAEDVGNTHRIDNFEEVRYEIDQKGLWQTR